MPHYHKLGQVPPKRHTQFRKPNGELYAEQLFSTEGFASTYSILYHHYPPTIIKSVDEPYAVEPKLLAPKQMLHRSFQGFNIQRESDFLKSRKYVLANKDVHIALAAPEKSTDSYFIKNADADEMIFVHEGSGTLKTMYGNIDFEYGDYLIIPRGTVYQIYFNDANNRLLVMESFSPIVPPKRYLNEVGQLLEHAPYCERDIKGPVNLQTYDEKGDFLIYIRKTGMMYPYHYLYHPFDVVGWDGCNYPWAFSIHNFEPITGRIHQPPPVHQTFEGRNYVVCSFVPRLFDYHPDAIPAPYNHSNIDSDEVLYYVDGDFMSRKKVTRGMITLHPGGIPHGPHPGTVEKSIGAKETRELAVMIDTFHPLLMTEEAVAIEDKDYYLSWMSDKDRDSLFIP
ncbi:MAG: homogentisate 1,2-dioxygenase [Chitinophagales bacterium]|nr:homogentisate 1,2-dioxygenase [Chitinophagales bacterium]